MLRVNNKNTIMASIVGFEHIPHLSQIVDFEQVNVTLGESIINGTLLAQQ